MARRIRGNASRKTSPRTARAAGTIGQVTKKRSERRGQQEQDRDETVAGVVRAFDPDEGWGIIDAPQVPGGCFVHFSAIEMDGYRAPAAGQWVRFRFEHLGFLQDGCSYRALAAWPET